MRGYLIRDVSTRHVIELVDLNYGGCGIHTPVELRPGERVELTVVGRGSIPAEVRWYNDGHAGLDFAVVEAPRKVVDRRTGRASIEAEVGLRVLGRNNYRVWVRDLSTDGCKVDLVERPREGDHMSVKFDGLEALDADVCWVEGHTAGLMFKNRIHPAVFELLLQRLGAA